MKRWLVYNIKTGEKKGYILAKTHREAANFLRSQRKWVAVRVVWQNRPIGFSDQWVVFEIETKLIKGNNIKDLAVSKHIYWSFEKHTGSRFVSTLPNFALKRVTNFGGKQIGQLEHLQNLPSVTAPQLLRKRENRHWYWTGWVYDDGKIREFEAKNLITGQIGWVRRGNIQLQKTMLERVFALAQSALLKIDKSFEGIVQGAEKIVEATKEQINNTVETAKKGFENIKVIAFASALLLLLSKLNNK